MIPKRRTRAKIPLCLLALAVSASLSYSPASADPAASDPYVTIDAKTLSDKYGTDYELTLQRAKDQAVAGDIASKLETIAGDRFSGAYVSTSGALALTVRVEGESRIPQVDEIASRSPMSVIIEYGATASIEDKRSFSDGEAFESWLDNNPVVVGVILSERDDVLTLLVNSDVRIPVELESSAASIGLEFSIEHVDGKSGDTNRGGRNMTSCTSGFVYSNGGPNQLVLARHCEAQSYYFFNGDGPFATQYTGMVYNANADLQWRKPVDHAGQGTFYADDITGVGRYQVGQSHGLQGEGVCRRGKVTGFDCGTIVSTSYKPTYSGACPSGPCNSTFALVSDAPIDFGDSGGPWFVGGYAYGITKGKTGSYAIYSKLGYLPTGLDIVIE